jgi:hypothetical protein
MSAEIPLSEYQDFICRALKGSGCISTAWTIRTPKTKLELFNQIDAIELKGLGAERG